MVVARASVVSGVVAVEVSGGGVNGRAAWSGGTRRGTMS